MKKYAEELQQIVTSERRKSQEMRIKHAEEVRYLNDLILDARQKVRRNDKLDILELCSLYTYNQH